MTMDTINLWGKAKKVDHMIEEVEEDLEVEEIPILDPETSFKEPYDDDDKEEEDGPEPDHFGWEEVYDLNGCSSHFG